MSFACVLSIFKFAKVNTLIALVPKQLFTLQSLINTPEYATGSSGLTMVDGIPAAESRLIPDPKSNEGDEPHSKIFKSVK